MRSNSASKKKAEYQRYLQSRVLITSNSLNPLSKHISSKLDLIKQQLSRQFHEKFPTEKQRTTSVKKNKSSSKPKRESESSKNMSGNPSKKLFRDVSSPQPQDLNKHSDNDMMRQKYYELQDKLLLEREKSMTTFEQLNLVKQQFIQFLEEPSCKTAQELKKYFPSQRNRLIIQKIISLSEDVQFAQTTLNQMMLIMEVEDIQSLINQLKSRQSKYRNLNQCTYKIMELQTAYNQLSDQSQEKIKQLQSQHIRNQQNLTKQFQAQIEQLKSQMKSQVNGKENECKSQIEETLKRLLQTKVRMFDDTSRENTSQDQNQLFQTFDKKKPFITGLNVLNMAKQNLTVSQFLHQIEDVFKSIIGKMEEIGREAEENMEQFLNSRNDMIRLEKLIQTITGQMQDQKNKLIHKYNEVIEEKQDIIQQCHGKIEEMERAIGMLNERIKKLGKQANEQKREIDKKRRQIQDKNEGLEQKIIIRDGKLSDIVRGLRDILEENEKDQFEDILESLKPKEQEHDQIFRQQFIRNKLVSRVKHSFNKSIAELKSKVQQAETMSIWHEKELKIKQNLLRQFDYNLKKLMEEVEMSSQKQKKLIFERDQYKYLLNNVRENMMEVKKENQQRIGRIVKEKDHELIMSNKDILQRNQALEEQLAQIKLKFAEVQSQLKAQKASHTFFMRKSEQSQSTMAEMRKKVVTAQTETVKYKKHLNEIEASFKEFESMSEENIKKISQLEQQNKMLDEDCSKLREQIQNSKIMLEKSEQNAKNVICNYNETNKRLKEIMEGKDECERENSELRIKQLQFKERIRQMDRELSQMKIENEELQKHKSKSIEEISKLTNRLLEKMENKKIRQSCELQKVHEAKKKIKNLYEIIKDQMFKMKKDIAQFLDQTKNNLCEDYHQILEASTIFTQHYTHQISQLSSKYSDLLQQGTQEQYSRMGLMIKKIKELKEETASVKQYNQYIKEQFCHQLQFVKDILTKAILGVQSQQQVINTKYDVAYRTQLHIHSLKNQVQGIKEDMLQQTKNNHQNYGVFIKDFSIFLNKIQQKLHIHNQKSRRQLSITNEVDQNLSYQTNEYDYEETYRKKSFEEDNNSFGMRERFNTDPNNEDEGQLQKKQNQSPSRFRKTQRLYTDQGEMKSPQFKHRYRRSSVSEKESEHMSSNFTPVLVQMDSRSGKKDDVVSVIHEQEVERISMVLTSLRDMEQEDPNLPYFHVIKPIYDEIKKKIKAKSLNLDISGVSFRPPTSPSSVSFSKDFLFDKRFNSEPNQEIVMRETNRSEYVGQKMSKQMLLRQIEVMHEKIEKMDQYINIMDLKEEEYKIKLSEQEKKIVEMENENSPQIITQLFLHFLKNLFEENWSDVETSCRTLLKMMKINTEEIRNYLQQLEIFTSKRKKRNSGGFMKIFN